RHQLKEEIAMKKLPLVTAALLALVFAGCSYMPFGGSGWTTLVDGASGMDNFNPVGDANWRAEDGAIVADKGKGGYLVSKNSYRGFQIRAVVWADNTTIRGCFIRCTARSKIGDVTSYRGNILNQRPEP